MRFPLLSAIWLLVATLSASADDVIPFQFDPTISSKDRVSEKQLQAVYKVIDNSLHSEQGARLAILNSLVGRNGFRWLMESEGPGYIILRNDIKGNGVFVKVEYDHRYIQIKYHHGFDDFSCETLVGEYCYETHKVFYKFAIRLRRNIEAQINVL